jgi:hypothetical protein
MFLANIYSRQCTLGKPRGASRALGHRLVASF